MSDNLIKISLAHDFSSIGGGAYVDFDFRLHYRGSDVTLYANTWPQAAHAQDTPVFTSILNELFDSRSGVEKVQATPFKMVVSFSSAVSTDRIVERIKRGVRNAGYNLVYSNNDRNAVRTK